jgi:hypothetical protein
VHGRERTRGGEESGCGSVLVSRSKKYIEMGIGIGIGWEGDVPSETRTAAHN